MSPTYTTTTPRYKSTTITNTIVMLRKYIQTKTLSHCSMTSTYTTTTWKYKSISTIVVMLKESGVRISSSEG